VVNEDRGFRINQRFVRHEILVVKSISLFCIGLSDWHRAHVHVAHVVWHAHCEIFGSIALLLRWPQDVLRYFDIIRVKATLFTADDANVDPDQ